MLLLLQLVFAGLGGYIIFGFGTVWVANFYMSMYNRLRLDIKHENVKISVDHESLKTQQGAR